MKLIEPIYIPSKEVTSWLSIKDEAEELARFVDDIRNSVYAIHHMQVSDKPLNFFVLKPEVLGPVVQELGSRFIINPVITKYFQDKNGVPIFQKVKEGCASFPHKSMKNVSRSPLIVVKYQIPDETGTLIEKTMEVYGLVAQIFQHEVDHAHGKNIYYEHPKSIQPGIPRKTEASSH